MTRRRDIIWQSVRETLPSLERITESTSLGHLEEGSPTSHIILKRNELVTVRGTADRVVNGIVGRGTVKLVITTEGDRGWINWYESEPVV